VGASFEQPIHTGEITAFGVVKLLEEIKKFNKSIKFYQASSSEMYGIEKSKTKNEIEDVISNSLKLKKLGWKPMFSLNEGLQITYDWFKQN